MPSVLLRRPVVGRQLIWCVIWTNNIIFSGALMIISCGHNQHRSFYIVYNSASILKFERHLIFYGSIIISNNMRLQVFSFHCLPSQNCTESQIPIQNEPNEFSWISSNLTIINTAYARTPNGNRAGIWIIFESQFRASVQKFSHGILSAVPNICLKNIYNCRLRDKPRGIFPTPSYSTQSHTSITSATGNPWN